MPLATLTAGRLAFDKAAIMRRAYQIGRFALQLGRARREPAAEINRTLSGSLKKAWAEAKAEAYALRQRAAVKAETKARVARMERDAAALAATFRNDRAAIRFELEREHYRQHFNPGRIDVLRGALASIGA